MNKVYYYENDLCWASLHGSAPKLVRLRRWNSPSKSWLCEAVDWHHTGNLYVRPRMLRKVQDGTLSPYQSKASLSPTYLCRHQGHQRHQRLSSESEDTRHATEESSNGSTTPTSDEDDADDHPDDNRKGYSLTHKTETGGMLQSGKIANKKKQQRASKRQMLQVQCDSVNEWYIKDQPPEIYVQQAKNVLNSTPFECDINPDKTAQILALIAFRTHQSPRDAFEKFLFHLGRSRTSPNFSSAIRPEEVDRAGERHGLYANMRSVLI